MADVIKRSYENGRFTERQQKDINNARARAVSQAWKQEQKYVEDGMGTRDWTPEQQEDILKNGGVQGYEGHHMRSVSSGKTYDEQMEIASDRNNIQFLEKTSENNEHLRAHNNNTRNRTNGYYDVYEEQMHDFGDREPHAPDAKQLSNPIINKEKCIEKQKEEKTEQKVDEYGVDISKSEHKREHSQSKNKSR